MSVPGVKPLTETRTKHRSPCVTTTGAVNTACLSSARESDSAKVAGGGGGGCVLLSVSLGECAGSDETLEDAIVTVGGSTSIGVLGGEARLAVGVAVETGG